MTSNRVCSLALLVGLGALASPATANATVVWTSGFETGNISPDWMPSVNAGGNNVVVQQEHVYTGNYACEITVHPTDLFNGQDRVDIKHQSTLTGDFWESNGSFQNIIDFWVEPKTGGGTTIGFGVGPLGATQIWTADFVIGKWHQISLHGQRRWKSGRCRGCDGSR
jgi:hypothetical protein